MEYQSQEINKISEALSKAQGEMKVAEKNKEALYGKFANLQAHFDAIREPLKNNGLSVLQRGKVIEGRNYLSTILTHSSGQWIESLMPLRVDAVNDAKTGANLTYMRRYALGALMGIAAGDDNDAGFEVPEKGVYRELHGLMIAYPDMATTVEDWCKKNKWKNILAAPEANIIENIKYIKRAKGHVSTTETKHDTMVGMEEKQDRSERRGGDFGDIPLANTVAAMGSKKGTQRSTN